MPIVVRMSSSVALANCAPRLRQLANLMRRVRALGHVGRGTALQVPIGQPRNLAEERRAQARFEPPAKTERHRRDRHLEEQEDPRQAHDRGHRREALARERQVSAEIEQASKEQRFHDDAGGRKEQARREEPRAPEPRRLAGATGDVGPAGAALRAARRPRLEWQRRPLCAPALRPVARLARTRALRPRTSTCSPAVDAAAAASPSSSPTGTTAAGSAAARARFQIVVEACGRHRARLNPPVRRSAAIMRSVASTVANPCQPSSSDASRRRSSRTRRLSPHASRARAQAVVIQSPTPPTIATPPPGRAWCARTARR